MVQYALSYTSLPSSKKAEYCGITRTFCCESVTYLVVGAGDKRVKEWLDATDVCFLLNIRKRQLQNYRDSGKIGFSKIGNVIMYRPDDVMKLLKKAE